MLPRRYLLVELGRINCSPTMRNSSKEKRKQTLCWGCIGRLKMRVIDDEDSFTRSRNMKRR